jgi:hypothetical protein
MRTIHNVNPNATAVGGPWVVAGLGAAAVARALRRK